ncbi:MAG: phenylalanine--tRNA ligase subunit beta [Candidatus Eremiobacteraeota bacterium]|nr:phenylalanine--tRNA ligase subunit beta [Candidatus Eremiobacteraeota bacterium]
MRTPLAWLRDYVDLPAETQAIVEKLAMLGFPVEAVDSPPPLSGIVAGKLAKVEKHPNADRLFVCSVDIGAQKPLTIATAATNVAQGQVVPVATIGAQLAGGLKIEPRTMRGIASEGMLVSANELGLEADWFEDGIMQLDPQTPLGSDVVKLFGLDQDVLEVEVTSNRVDAMSMLGLARELAAAFGTSVREPDSAVDYAAGGEFSVEIESPDCKRFVAQRVSNVQVRTAKTALRVRLALAGQRPISNVVDISNFVMLETGQPLHFYDYERLAGRRLIVRDARDGERVKTLDGIDYTLAPRMLVIADEQETQCLAGLKGAAASEVGPATREIAIEAANFTGARVRRMGSELALRSDASARHEKALPLALTDVGAARAARLLVDEGATVYAPHGFGQAAPAPPIVALRKREVRRLLGYELESAEIARILESLGFSVRESAVAHDGVFEVEVPLWRSDVTIEADLVEEIARLAGYDRVVAAIPPTGQQAIASEAYEMQRRVAETLAMLGYREVATLALQPASVHQRWGTNAVEIANPLSEDQHYMRFSLIPALLQLRQDKIFEIGDVFGDAGEIVEKTHAAFVRRTTAPQAQSWSDEQFVALKADAIAFVRRATGRLPDVRAAKHHGWHPGICAELTLDGNTIAIAGALDPRLGVQFETDGRVHVAQVDLAALPAPVVPRYRAPSRYPSLSRDLALVVDLGVSAQQIETVIGGAVDGLARTIRAFDEYHGPQVGAGKKSLAVRIVMQRDDATMTDAEADTAIEKILGALKSELGATLRSG